MLLCRVRPFVTFGRARNTTPGQAEPSAQPYYSKVFRDRITVGSRNLRWKNVTGELLTVKLGTTAKKVASKNDEALIVSPPFYDTPSFGAVLGIEVKMILTPLVRWGVWLS